MLLKTNQKSVHGKAICLPIIGEVQVSEEGHVDVTDEVAELLLQGQDWTAVEVDEEEEDEEVVDKKEAVSETKTEKVKETTAEAKKDAPKAEKASKTAKEETKPKAKATKEGETTELSAEALAMHAEIDKMSLEDLITMAENAKTPGYHLFKSDVKKMRAFMKRKVQ